MLPVRLLTGLAGLLYPKLCRFCGCDLGDGGVFFCGDCIESARRLEASYCGVCSRPFPDGSGGVRRCSSCASKHPPFNYARAPYIYDGVVKEAIHLYKYGGIRAVEGFLSSGFEGLLEGWFGGVNVVAAVPLHRKRLRERGFNQSLLLARSASRALGVGLSVDGLVRTRYTRPQINLSPGEREENVRGAFAAARPGEFAGRDVLLVDDVYTTGATVRECARVLKGSGADSVYVLSVARAEEVR
jgi:ComF family protein